MFPSNSIIYSKTYNRALWVEDLLELQKEKENFHLYATNSKKETDINHTSIKEINKVDNTIKNKTQFYKVITENGFEIIIPDNNEIFLEARGGNGYKEDVLYYNANTLKQTKSPIYLKMAIPSFFTEVDYKEDVLKTMDRDGAILALFMSRFSSAKLSNPYLKFAIFEKPFVKKISSSFRREFKVDELIRSIFGDEIWRDLKIIFDEESKKLKKEPYKFITESSHMEAYKEVLERIYSPHLDLEIYNEANLGFTENKILDKTSIHFLQTNLTPRTIYSFIYHLFKIEEINQNLSESNTMSIINPSYRRVIQDLGLIGNLFISQNKEKLILSNKKMESNNIYEKLINIIPLSEEEIKNFDFIDISTTSHKLVVNGFITYLDKY